MAKLSKANQYAIQYLHQNSKDAEAISKELGVSINQVNKFIETLSKNDTKTSPAKTDKTKDLMIRQTSAKKMNSVSIMTEAASQVGDEFIKTVPQTPRDTSGYIFRPNK